MDAVQVVAFAKVNLSLEVLGKRTDGFHQVRTAMQSISLADRLEMLPKETLSLECDQQALEGEDNLVLRAAQVLQAAAPPCHRGLEGGAWSRGARIVLRKGIPVAAGLGGASSDAAATLVGLSRLWRLDTPPEGLRSLAAQLGSDVPFFLAGGTALAGGRGEVIEPLPDALTRWMVLLVPPHGLAGKTAQLYRLLRPEHWSSGERTLLLAESLRCSGETPEELLGNAFEAVADRAFPELAACRRAMLVAGAASVHLSGAGPALFSFFRTEAEAREVGARLSRAGYTPLRARTLTADEARPRAVTLPGAQPSPRPSPLGRGSG